MIGSYTRLFADAEGASRFEDVEIEWLRVSRRLPLSQPILLVL